MSSARKLNVFDFPGLRRFSPVLYLDLDVLVVRPLASVFAALDHAELLYAGVEPETFCSNYKAGAMPGTHTLLAESGEGRGALGSLGLDPLAQTKRVLGNTAFYAPTSSLFSDRGEATDALSTCSREGAGATPHHLLPPLPECIA